MGSFSATNALRCRPLVALGGGASGTSRRSSSSGGARRLAQRRPAGVERVAALPTSRRGASRAVRSDCDLPEARVQASAGHPVSGLPLAVGGGYGDCRIPGEEAFLEGLVVSPLSSLILWIGAAVMSAVVVVWMAVRGSRQRRAMLRER